MKLLVILIVLVCAAVALWYFRDEITGAKLRFGEREEAGARFEAPNWRESAHDADPADGRLILKHKRNDNRIFYLAWQYGEAPTPDERLAAAKEYARALGKMTASRASVKPETSLAKIGGREARVFALTFEKVGIGPGRFYVWHVPAIKQRWFFAIVDDDLDERERIVQQFFGSFRADRSTMDSVSATKGKLVFDAPAGWRVLNESPLQVLYVSPGRDVLLQLNHGARTSQPNMTKEYAAVLTDHMIEAVGATWRSREVRIETDWDLGLVAHVRGVALIEGDEHFYEIRLWISPKTNLLYITALSAPDQQTLDKHLAVFSRITCEE